MATPAAVAPDFEVRSHFNSLRVKPEYRITLRLGEIEKLFQHKPGTREGRMERLQVLGLFYFPLSHGKANARYDKTWPWVKERVFSEKGKTPKTDPEADAIIQSALKCRIIGGAAPAGWGDAPSELPPDAADPARPDAANFAKIRLPGGYAVSYKKEGGLDLNVDPACPAEFITTSLFDHEAKFYKDNPVLGKIPLVAKVERRPPGGADWAPAEGVDVHFQLVPAFDLPAYDSGRPASGQFNRPPLRDTLGGYPDSGSGVGTQKRVDAEEGFDLDPADPQGRNCHKDFGGHRKQAGVEDFVFSVQDVKGFSQSGKPYPKAAKATPAGDAHQHAVKAATNAEGEAGVIFMPSRMSGDRYRIRAYLPSTGDGASPGSAAATTGTFVVWRNIRISRLLRQELSATPDKRLTDDGKNYGQSTPEAYLEEIGAHDGSAFTGLDTVNLGETDGTKQGRTFDPLPRQYARAFCELELDSGAVETLAGDEFNEARRIAVDDAKDALRNNPLTFPTIKHLDLDLLFCHDLTFAGPETTVCALPMRGPRAYNAAAPGTAQIDLVKFATVWGEMVELAHGWALAGFMRVLSHNGALPGLTLAQGAMGYSWQILTSQHFSGILQIFRGSFLWYGSTIYETLGPYDATSNTAHELGHAMFMPHAPDVGKRPEEVKPHDALSDCVCVMSYEKGLGHYCGKTLFTLRGWNITPMK